MILGFAETSGVGWSLVPLLVFKKHGWIPFSALGPQEQIGCKMEHREEGMMIQPFPDATHVKKHFPLKLCLSHSLSSLHTERQSLVKERF